MLPAKRKRVDGSVQPLRGRRKLRFDDHDEVVKEQLQLCYGYYRSDRSSWERCSRRAQSAPVSMRRTPAVPPGKQVAATAMGGGVAGRFEESGGGNGVGGGHMPVRCGATPEAAGKAAGGTPIPFPVFDIRVVVQSQELFNCMTFSL